MEGVIMAYVLLDADKIVIQKQGYAQTGFIEVADTVVCGMKQNTDGSFSEVDQPELDYTQKREQAYPGIREQLDMQYHDAVDGTTTWKDAIKAVKDKYPKE